MPRLKVPCECQWSSRELMHMDKKIVNPSYDYLINIFINLNDQIITYVLTRRQDIKWGWGICARAINTHPKF